MNAPVDYWGSFVGPEQKDLYFKLLHDEIAWEFRDRVPRGEYYSNDTDVPYTYGAGRGVRTYYRRPWHRVMTQIRRELEWMYGCVFDVCFLNLYETSRDQLGWHADDSPEMDPARPIVTVSLGAEREIWFRRTACHVCAGKNGVHGDYCSFMGDPKDALTEKLMLHHGSAAVMLPGMQQSWQHRIPKSPHNECGPRISLTYRGYLSHELQEAEEVPVPQLPEM